VVFQNPDRGRPDHEVWRDDLKLADMAEPLGFDSIWTVEHHFTDYMLAPNPMQFLTYMAGRTKSVQLGSMVVVLPWHDPMWQAEQIAMLDTISEGRLILGSGGRRSPNSKASACRWTKAGRASTSRPRCCSKD
jgi:alkanesulfonate monooxygenase SsuD/methylene tetrahydromethanopterin reductase-like flavin-dependent oxidoreductase (luciferase family)